MPFDGTPDITENLRTNVIARMELLQEIAAKHEGDQREFSTCLWSEVRRNQRLLVAGLAEYDGGHDRPPIWPVAASDWFGFDDRAAIWGDQDIGRKRAAIANRLACLRVCVPA